MARYCRLRRVHTKLCAPVYHQGLPYLTGWNHPLLGKKLEDGSTKDYTNIVLKDLIQCGGKREEQPVTDSNDTGVDEDSVRFKSGSPYYK